MRSSSFKARMERREGSQSPLAEGAKVWRCLGFFLRPGGIEKVEDTANCPIAEGDSEYEGN